MNLVRLTQTSASSSTSIPTAPLQEALKLLENELTKEQRQSFLQSNRTFTPSDVIVFIAEIDANNQSSRKSVSSRLFTFLDSAQQFVGVIDTFVSSNPAVAALIWGGIKASLTIANNNLQYFDKVTVMITDIGKLSPTYSDFGRLYQHDQQVQKKLCEYYAAVIRICTAVVKLYSNPGLASRFLSSFEAHFKPLLEDLEKEQKHLLVCLHLASQKLVSESAQNIDKEFKAQTLYRQGATHLKSQIQEYLASQYRREVLENLSKLKTRQIWSMIHARRVGGTAEWFTQQSAFESWCRSTRTSILWCSGSMGVGKSVLVSSIIAHLEKNYHTKSIISYHFCQTGHEETLTARGVLGSITRQLLAGSIKQFDTDQLQSLLEDSRDNGIEGFVDILERYYKPGPGKSYFIILDGLDECLESDIVTIFSELRRLTSNPNFLIRLLYSCRSDLKEVVSKILPYDMRLIVVRENTRQDIEKFIEVTLQQCIDEEKLKITDPNLFLRIVEVLETNHDGMFLWLSLFIEELCAQTNEADIIHALDHPPAGINELYSRKLLRIRSHGLSEYCLDVLRFTGVARRPLKMEEMREALGVDIDQREFDARTLPRDMNRVITACEGLIHNDEGTDTLRYVHSSLYLYLFQEASGKLEGFDHGEANLHFSSICLTYLSFRNFTKQVTVAPRNKPPIEPLDFARAQFKSSASLSSKLIHKLLSSRNSGVSINSQSLGGMLQHKSANQTLHFDFFEFASKNWLQQTGNIVISEQSDFWKKFHRCMENQDLNEWKPWLSPRGDSTVRLSDGDKALTWALVNRHNTLILYLMTYQKSYLDGKTWRIIREYAVMQDSKFVEAVLQRHLKTHGVWTLMWENLSELVAKLNVENLRSLIDAGIGVDSAIMNGQTMLQWASDQGNIEVVKMLLAASASINYTTIMDERTPLHHASSQGHIRIVQELLITGARVNIGNKLEWTPLHAASERGHAKVARELLTAGADVEAVDSYKQTPLRSASNQGRIEVMRILIAAGANLEAADNIGKTSLHGASNGGHLEVVRILIAAGANTEAADNMGKTSLHEASNGGHLEVVRLFLKGGSDINVTDRTGETPLHHASRRGHHCTVRALLVAGAHFNVLSDYGDSPLDIAIRSGNKKAVRILQEHERTEQWRLQLSKSEREA